MNTYKVTAANLNVNEPISVTARNAEHAIEKVEKFLGKALYKAVAEKVS